MSRRDAGEGEAAGDSGVESPETAPPHWKASLDAAPRARLFLIIAGPLFLLYFAMPTLWGIRSIDPYTNVLTAHSMATEQSVYLDEYEELTHEDFRGRLAWVIWGEDRPVSQYPPGAPAHALPAYALLPYETHNQTFFRSEEDPGPPVELEVPPLWPGDLTAALVTAIAIGMLGLTFSLLAPGSLAVPAAYVAGLGTSVWSVASQELWQHGPAMMWISIAGYALARARSSGAGCAFAAAVVVRPLTGVIAVAPAVLAAFRRRWSAAVPLVAGVAVGAGVVLLYNQAVFGEPSISGGYGSGRTSGLSRTNPAWYLGNIAWGLLHPRYGLLLWSPFLVFLFAGVGTAWKHAPDWVRGPAVGGLGYLAMNWLMNRSSGGALYLFYRYPLEPLVAAAPLLLLSYVYWVRPRPRVRKLAHVGIVAGIAVHALAALG